MALQSQSSEDFEIRSLVLRERFYKDTFQWDKWRRTYHDDDEKTWIEIAWISGTIDKFVRESKQMANRVSSTHFIQPVDVQIHGAKALAHSYGHITLRSSDDGHEYDMVSWGWWIHRAVKVEGASGTSWMLVAMRFIYDRDSIIPTCPSSKATLDVHTAEGARSSYKYLHWVLTRRGYEISAKLAGSDDRSSVESLRAQEEHWLNSTE
ncbi:uncharacterized protein A1O9_06273 [Exophiala aquamarina CBS 119918]|uniref:SnoaL-like domain-containing protein n=1 Tax=Exophiala aquamarina CBS 119918 TaxID=1182545 RepID=A0A072PF29_9EURO|nr:uncharacterized protein A1O9_06273 [Exophiala aquamarina CBS 119918]KEF58347.1 hypothetical protein A1O9_06273 [Exophiala aquamarina CBS 119918]